MPPLQPPPFDELFLRSDGHISEIWKRFLLKLQQQAVIPGTVTVAGPFGATFTLTGPTSVIFPTSGTLATAAGSVTTIAGTANEIAASAAVGAITLSLIGPHAFTTQPVNGVLYGNLTAALQAVTPNGTATNKFLTQASGLAPAWATLAASDIPKTSVGLIDTTGLTANVGASTLYAVPASGAGLYRVSAYVVETTAGSLSSVLPNVQIIYTDLDSSASVTLDATPILGIAGIGQTGALSANAIGTVASGVIPINVKASTTIQYQTVNYASNLAGMVYALHLRIEAL